jgi:predicted negative regulator of RcsB-dependent stress response
VDRYTRRELKEDEFQNTIDALEDFYHQHARQIFLGGAAAIVIVAAVVGWRTYSSRQEAAANVEFQKAITTFDAYVGAAPENALTQSEETYPTAQAKYEAALREFAVIIQQYPHTKATQYAQIHIGLCEALLGNTDAALKQLHQAARASDKDIASLAQFSLAGELAQTGKLDEAAKIYQSLAGHPTTTVPRATALLALADAYRATQPDRSRQIYEQIQKELGSDAVIAEAVKEDLADLPQQSSHPAAH